MMAELFPKNDDNEYQDISGNFKNIVEEHGKIEAHEMFIITDEIRCQTCRQPLDIHVAHVDRQIQEQVAMSRNKFSKSVMNTHDERICCFRRGNSKGTTIARSEGSKLYHKARDHLKSAKKKAQTNILD